MGKCSPGGERAGRGQSAVSPALNAVDEVVRLLLDHSCPKLDARRLWGRYGRRDGGSVLFCSDGGGFSRLLTRQRLAGRGRAVLGRCHNRHRGALETSRSGPGAASLGWSNVWFTGEASLLARQNTMWPGAVRSGGRPTASWADSRGRRHLLAWRASSRTRLSSTCKIRRDAVAASSW